jgi:hypothetical protein
MSLPEIVASIARTTRKNVFKPASPAPAFPNAAEQKTAERQAHEKTPDFKKAQRFRAGIEGRISVLFRGRGMKRCLGRKAPNASRLSSALPC